MSFCVNLFDNKLLICGLLLLWTVVSSSVFCAIMIQDGSNFLMIGPNERNQLFGVKMDSWFKWWVTAIYTFVSTAIAAFASDSLCPFFTNAIEDHKTKHIPYSKFTCLMMVQVFTIYGVIMSVIGMFVALTQYNEWKVLSSETNKKQCRSHDTADGTEKCSSSIEFELEDAHTDNEKSSMLKVEL